MEGDETSEAMLLSRIQSMERKRKDLSEQLAQIDQSLSNTRADYLGLLNRKAPIGRLPPEGENLLAQV